LAVEKTLVLTNVNTIAGQCRKKSMTSGTGLNPDAGLKQLTTGRNADAGQTFFRIPAFRHLLKTENFSWFSSSLDCSTRSTSTGCLAVNIIDKGRFVTIFLF
jgi:hypothetical protein